MPIWLRRFTHSTINEFYKKEKEEFDKHMGKEELTNKSFTPNKKPTIPVPDYIASAKRYKK